MALEGAERQLRCLVRFAARSHLIAEPRERLLHRGKILRPLGRLGPFADAGCRKPLPIEQLAGIDLARWGNIGMAEHALGRYGMALENRAAEQNEGRHLRLGEGPVAEFMSRIYQFNADGDAVDVALAGPV